jgi:hypothetical protein
MIFHHKLVACSILGQTQRAGKSGWNGWRRRFEGYWLVGHLSVQLVDLFALGEELRMDLREHGGDVGWGGSMVGHIEVSGRQGLSSYSRIIVYSWRL